MSNRPSSASFAIAGGALWFELGLWLLRRRRRVVCVGRSMEPTLRAGDHLFVRAVGKHNLEPGAVVVARHSVSPSGLIVKRVQDSNADAVWLVSDNQAGCDSFTLGWVKREQLLGVVTACVRRK